MAKQTTEGFIEKARKVHGDKYNYSKVEYHNNHEKVCIICPEHGEFWQRPSGHLRGRSCPICSGRYMDTKLFIKKARDKHGNKYDYSKTEYIGDKKKVCIICPEHGEFWQDPYSHLTSCGCPICGNRFTDTKIFIEKAHKIHGNKYSYDKVEYVNNTTKIIITCPIHGDFTQTPREHLDGCGCQKCAQESRITKRTSTTAEYINKAKIRHGSLYDYSKTQYTRAKQKVCIICPEHGEFWQEAFSHLNGCGCPKCANNRTSKKELEIYEYMKTLLPNANIIQNDRNTIKPYELDIYIPEKKIAIEFNGIFWHTEKYTKDKYYHYNKMLECSKIGIRLIQIYEDEYDNHKDIVLNKLRHILMCDNSKKIYARKCHIQEIDFKLAKNFLNENHIQGCVPSTVYLGCFYGDLLVGVMTFKLENKNSNNWELNRFATLKTFSCVGVGGKLFKFFLNEYRPKIVKSFADRRWSIKSDNLYTKLGFKLVKELKPDYEYYCGIYGINRIHKFNFRKKNLIKKFNLNENMTESEMCKEIGAYKIWNCGLLKYVYDNQ